MIYAAGQFPKRCTKCSLLISEANWRLLPLVGVQEVPADPDDKARPAAYRLEMRNHICNTTLGVEGE